MTRASFARWIEAYETAWRAASTEPLGELFGPTATYRAAPFDEPVRGLEAIAEFWKAERVGPGELFVLDFELVAVEDNVGVARIEVRYGGPVARTYRDLWVVVFDAEGRCSAFEEWPFFPGQPRIAP